MVPEETAQYAGILSLLLHFRWTWIGVLTTDDDNGERFVKNVLPVFYENGVCFDFVEKATRLHVVTVFDHVMLQGARIHDKIMSSKANAMLVYGESDSMVSLRWLAYLSEIEEIELTFKPKAKVWIITAQMELMSTAYQRTWDANMFHGAISVTIHSNNIPAFQQFIQNRKFHDDKENGYIRDFWEHAFGCTFPSEVMHERDEDICTGKEKVDSLPGSFFEMSMTGHSYSIYNAVYAVAYALNDMFSSGFKLKAKMGRGRLKSLKEFWQLHQFLKIVSFNNSVGDKIFFDHNGQLIAVFDVINWIIYSNQSFHRVKIGKMDPEAPLDQVFTINNTAIIWHNWFNQVQPLSQCNDNCYPGYSKKIKEGEPFCCYDCMPCPEGKISSEKDMDECYTCRDEYYPNKKHDLCIPRDISYLSYEEPLGIALAFLALLLSFITCFILVIFLKYQNTPIIIANNRNLTYILLIALLFCFLCALLFIGQPQKVTCLLQQTAFGIIFSVAVSCVLAKTITVLLAFMATKPGSKMRKWVGKTLTYCIVISCPLIQTGICVVWLATFPPFPSPNTNSVREEIILECNNNSATMFYCVLAYMGFLAAASFVVAFLSRELPDTFNEARFISFSMLVFCSVWISFIPSYLSTKGKSMVAVEIFSILISSTGLLGCITFPKCYIILFRPNLNNRETLMKKKLRD
ncbi:vomeronasal type-2 receptor 26-like [Anolis carolinensis]|uniref:vomeronasal type-2 receptor 26-like n=1 Tax=Anolis carolinensis TaxID=28377 RepID=UPI002F2B861C